jgi:Cache domain
VPSENEQKEGFLLSIWQAIALVGDVRERSDEIDTLELETVLAEAESLLIAAVSEVAQRPGGPARRRRWLRFWKPAHDTPSDDVSWGGVTSVIPFPGTTTLDASSSFRFGKSTAPKTGKAARMSQPALLPHFNPGGAESGPPSFRSRSGSIGRQVRLLVLVVLAVLPIIALQAWHERQLRNERQEVVRERVVYRVQQLAADIGELREGARQLLLAIAQLEAVKLRQPEPCFGLLPKLRSRYPNYSLLAAADAEGRIFCASGPTVASVADHSFFRRAMAHDGLVVGDYWVDPVGGQKVINFAQQFDDSNGHLAGVIFASLDLTWLSDHLKGNGLTPTSSKLIADRQGNIIARLPHPEEFIGKNMRGSHESIMEGGEAGWEEVTGVDGVTRIFGYVPSSLPPRDFFLSIGEAKTESFAVINRATWRDAALILAGLLASICIAWAGRNLVFGTAQALRQSTPDHRPSIRQHLVRLASPWGIEAILPGGKGQLHCPADDRPIGDWPADRLVDT